MSEYQRGMRWRLILKDCGPNIHHISGVYNIVADMIIIFPSTSVKNYGPSTSKIQNRANRLFTIDREGNNKDCLP